MAEVIVLIIVIASLVLNLCVALPAWREEHHFRQESRLKWDGYQPVWWMCWTYWIGVEKLFFRKKIHTEEIDAAYMRREFD